MAGIIGTLVSILAGYMGTWWDQSIMRITDAWLTLPSLVFAILLSSIRGPKALFAASLPSHPDEAREEIVLSGEVPSVLTPPAGCHFHPCYPFAMPRCSGQEPELIEVAAGHQVPGYLY